MSSAFADSPEYNSNIAMEIVNKYHCLDEEQFDKETDISVEYTSPLGGEERILPKSTRKDIYVVSNEVEKAELKKALNHLFEANAVYYKQRIHIEEN